MFSKSIVKVGLVALVVFGSAAAIAYASHSWETYHWERTENPFSLKLGDNVTAAWDSYLNTASSDWSASSVLDTTVVPGSSPKCTYGILGRIEVCNRKYGFSGWLGLAQIFVSDGHIIAGLAKLNDTYFNTATYNTPAWKKLVVCQEIAHDFGLDHQDEIHNNPNLGSCMDYTNDPDGGAGGAVNDDPSNEHPNAHDYEQLETIYQSHLEASVGQAIASRGNQSDADDAVQWGRALRHDGQGKTSLHVRDLGNGQKVFTFILWVD